MQFQEYHKLILQIKKLFIDSVVSATIIQQEYKDAGIAPKDITVGIPESHRTVISNIHKGGTPPVEAGLIW